jgi:MPBQ/MSBQ methyltransferase
MASSRYFTSATVLAELDLELLFATEVLKLRSLHYGYWNAGDNLTLAELRLAQTRYTETLLELIPETVKTILDVGAGVGDNAMALAARGHRVTAISPDNGHARYYLAAGNDNVSFRNVRFEDLELSEKFDLILMSESHNYFYADGAFAQCRRYLQPGGYLLVSGMFGRAETKKLWDILYGRDDYVALAKQSGFRLIRGVDITDHVLPTLELTQKSYRDYVIPVFGLLGKYLEKSAPLRWRVLKLLCHRQFRELKTLHRYYQERMDPNLFKQHATYERLLFCFDG